MSIKKSMAKYPCVSGKRKQPDRKNKLCKICKKRADYIVTIQWWWSRGDDSDDPFCLEHVPVTKEDILKAYPQEKV